MKPGLSLTNWLISTICFSALLAGCAPRRIPPPPAAAPVAAPPPAAAYGPHAITNLSQLSTADAPITSLAGEQHALDATPVAAPTPSMGAHGPRDDTPATLRRLFLSEPAHYTEAELPHSEERLLNAKAAEYSGFSSQMLAQLLKSMIELEKKPPIVTLPLPDDLKPVILTAVLDNQGQLQELILEQRSGIAAVDNFVVAACKDSMWANNLPEGALASDGNYRLRIEAKLSHYSADREGYQTFITRLGLAIL
jgi:hypothetical protein